jgi:alanine racemase
MNKKNDMPSGLVGQRPTWAEISLSALKDNYRAVRALVGPTVEIAAVVKADSYGHGSLECSKALVEEGASFFAVALPEEGIALRDAGITQRIICLGGFWRGQADACLNYGLTPVVYNLEMIEALSRAASKKKERAKVHIKIDTGMGRLGFRTDSIPELLNTLKTISGIEVEGLMTHFASADDPNFYEFTEGQIEKFNRAQEEFRTNGISPAYLHLANTPGIFNYPDGRGNMVRPGGILYGLLRNVIQSKEERLKFKPVMSLYTRIIHLKTVPAGELLGYGGTYRAQREMAVATLPIGYNDGYFRSLSNCGKVLVNGRFAPVVGRVSMDLTLIDVSEIEKPEIGSKVTLIGRDNDLEITSEDIGDTVGTISYEVTCRIARRVPRIYL